MGALARMVLGMKQPTKQRVQKVSKDQAYETRTVHDSRYLKNLIEWLEEVANKPVGVGNHAAMIESVGRSNAFREILQRLRKDLSTAERMIAEDQQRQRGR
jgi:hypothetical protein